VKLVATYHISFRSEKDYFSDDEDTGTSIQQINGCRQGKGSRFLF